MNIVVIPQPGTITASGGTATATIAGKHHILNHIFVKAATSTTTFDVKLTDRFDNDVFVREDLTGELSELTDLPGYGNWTLTVENASADEAFKYVLGLRK